MTYTAGVYDMLRINVHEEARTEMRKKRGEVKKDRPKVKVGGGQSMG
jgi:hypothetical protein